jgi:hypothetical protein
MYLVFQCAKNNMGDKKTIEENYDIQDCVEWMLNVKFSNYCEWKLNKAISDKK